MANKIQLRRDTAANWTSSNPTLSQGEQGYETDTGKLKIGDGSTAWTSLAYNTSYSDADVDTHLNKSTATTGEVLSWSGTDYDWIAAGGGADLYSANESSPAAQPSATGGNAVAIGDSAAASGVDSFSIGLGATAGASYSVALGRGASVTSTGANGVGIGYQSVSSGNSGIALGYANASGSGSFSSQLNSNSSTYGSKGSLSAAIGVQATANNTQSVAIGALATASVDKQVALGSSTAQVKISNAYTLPTADGTANQVLTTDGSGAVTFATAGGGGGASAQTIDIKTADYTVVSGDLGKIIKYFGGNSDRTVTLTAGATLGEGFHVTILNANSGADERVVIDANSTERFGWSNGPQTITLSRGELVRIIWDNTGGRWIIGEGGFNLAMRSDINPSTSTAVGDGVNSGIALGYNAQSAGSQAIALGRAYASGTDSFAAAITDNTSSYGASGANSIAIGYQAKATNTHSTSIGSVNNVTAYGGFGAGDANTVSGDYGVAIGRGNTSGATVVSRPNVALGYTNVATGGLALALGGNSDTKNIWGKVAHAAGRFAANGDAQSGQFTLRADTTDATAEALTTNNSTASATNQVVLPNNSVYGFTGTVIARENSAATNDFAVWEIKGGAVRAASAATTALGSYNINKISESTGAATWSIALSADTTNGAVAITVTGEASHSIRWVATVNTTEVTY